MRQVRFFQVGDVLRASFGVCRRDLATVAALAVVTYLPLFALVALYDLPEVPAMPPPPQDPAQGREYFLELFGKMMSFHESMAPYWLAVGLSSLWNQGALAYVAVRSLRAGAPRVRESLWQSVRAIPCVIVVGVLVGVATVAGTLLFIVPGLILMLVLWVAIPAAVVERRFGSALRRSHELTRGHKVPLFGLLLLLAVIDAAGGLVLPSIVADAAPRFGTLAGALVDAVVSSFSAVVIAVCYHDLRVLKEGMGTGAVAKVFE